jgi:hypothetical protein
MIRYTYTGAGLLTEEVLLTAGFREYRGVRWSYSFAFALSIEVGGSGRGGSPPSPAPSPWMDERQFVCAASYGSAPIHDEVVLVGW